VYGDTPFLVMILEHQWIFAERRPVTSSNFSLLQLASLLDGLSKWESVILNQTGGRLGR
jgi:hypothetical protein